MTIASLSGNSEITDTLLSGFYRFDGSKSYQVSP